MRRFINFLILAIFLRHSQCRAQSSPDTLITLYFDSGKFEADSGQIMKLLSALNSNEFVIKKISGYTDTVGSSADNLVLSQKRSGWVSEFLKRHFVLTAGYPVRSYGEQDPVSLHEIALNRRVEILLGFLKKTEPATDTSKFSVVRVLELQKIYFKPDKAIMEPSSMPYLDNVAKILSSFHHEIFKIRGHVNWNNASTASADSGYRKKMDQLSADRAKAVFAILVDKGISPKRMFWKGMGNREMIYPHATTDDEKRKNMRVEILILKDLKVQ